MLSGRRMLCSATAPLGPHRTDWSGRGAAIGERHEFSFRLFFVCLHCSTQAPQDGGADQAAGPRDLHPADEQSQGAGEAEVLLRKHAAALPQPHVRLAPPWHRPHHSALWPTLSSRRCIPFHTARQSRDWHLGVGTVGRCFAASGWPIETQPALNRHGPGPLRLKALRSSHGRCRAALSRSRTRFDTPATV